MTDKVFPSYDLDSGLAAARPGTPTVAGGRMYCYVATDTHVISIWDGAKWVSFGPIASCTIVGTANEITVTNGDGSAGNPTLSLPAALTFTGKTVTGGTFASITHSGTTTFPGNTVIDSSGKVGIGMTPVNILDITQTQDAESLFVLLNGSAGVSARSTMRVHNGTSFVQFTQFGTGFTSAGVFRQDGGIIYSTGAGGFTIETGVNQPIYFVVNGVEVGRFIAARFQTSVPILLPNYTVAGLPAAGTISSGGKAFVTDSTVAIAAGLGLAPVGGGTNGVPVFIDNTPAWKIG